jgi:putative hemolysin
MLKKIDIDAVFKSKNPRLYNILPSFILSYIKRTVHQDRINSFLEHHAHERNFDFVHAVVQEFGIKIQTIGLENLPANGGCIVASNHPLGALDAMALLDEVKKVRTDIKFFVNDILLNLENLKDLFAGVNVVGKTPVDTLKQIEKIYAQNIAVFTFPAGLVSRKQFPNGIFGKAVIQDLEWKKSFISRAKRYKKNIIPVYIEGRNSNFFYALSNWRKRLGIKVNIEMLYLVNEMYKQRGKTITIIFGKEISYTVFDKRFTDAQWAQKLKEFVYEMGEQHQSLSFEVK